MLLGHDELKRLNTRLGLIIIHMNQFEQMRQMNNQMEQMKPMNQFGKMGQTNN